MTRMRKIGCICFGPGRRVLAIVLVMVFAIPSLAQNNKKTRNKKRPKAPVMRLPESVRSESKIKMDVIGVHPSRKSRAIAAASEIDRMIATKLAAAGQVPNPRADDETFLRRIYLDVAGRIPTLEETRSFLESKDRDKRERLIDELLGSPDSVSHFYNVWADVLRLVERPQPNLIADPYLHYVKDSIRTNKPYDQWVYEMLTADGKTWENPATGFQLRDDGMALPYIDNTVAVFLGTQIGCAQCHDHPFDEWTQYQFYELAAYTVGVSTRMRRGSPGYKKENPSNKLIARARKEFDKGRVPGHLQRIARANMYVVQEKPRRMKLPKDYAYDDAKPGEVVEPAVPWGEEPDSERFRTPRQTFAGWVTSPDNPKFSMAIANRYWKLFTGVGLVEPVDDLSDDHPPSNEELMEFLADEIVDNGFDLKEFSRAILYTQTYQREAASYDPAGDEPFRYAGPAIRRMSAEQLWDSMLTLAVKNPMPFERPTAEQIAEVVDLDFTKITYDDFLKIGEQFKDSYFMGSYRRQLNKHGYKGNVLCRASEQIAPVSGAHFLRQFGQGDRETINGSDRSATVPQILAMFNGPITHVMLEAGSEIVDNVTEQDSTKERIDAIFLSVLSRYPSRIDRRVAVSELEQKGGVQRIGYGNIIWALLNTREFMFIH